VIKRVAIYLSALLALASLCQIAITGTPREKAGGTDRSEKTFALKCEFASRGFDVSWQNPRLFIVAEPLHLLILASPPVINTVRSAS
jgi:hypothetical protein